VLDCQGDYAGAFALYEQALGLYQMLGRDADAANCFYGEGNVLNRQGDYAGAFARYDQALGLYKTLGRDADAAECLFGQGIALGRQGDYAGAFALYEQALSLNRTLGRDAKAAGCLSNQGNVLDCQGDYAGAFALYEQALSLNRTLGAHANAADCLYNQGVVRGRQGATAALRGDAGDSGRRYREATVRFGLGLRVLEAAGIVSPTRGRLIAALYSNYRHLTAQEVGELHQSIQAFLAVLPAGSVIRADFQLLYAQALTDAGSGDTELVRTLIREATRTYEQNEPDSRGHAICLAQAGNLIVRTAARTDAEALSGAESDLRRAVRIVEAMHARERHGLLRTTRIFETHLDAYRGLIALLWNTDRRDEAYAFAERLRARSLAEDMATQSLIRQLGRPGADEEALRIANEHARALDRYNTAHDEIYWLHGRTEAATEEPRWRAAAREAETTLDRLEAEAVGRLGGAQHAAGYSPLDLPQAQSRIGDDTLLLCYTWLDDFLCMWAVRHDRLRIRRVSGHQLTAIVRNLDVLLRRHEVYGAQRTTETTSNVTWADGELWQAAENGSLRAEGREAATVLAKELVYALALPEMWAGVKHVTIVADGRLHELPFEMLPVSEEHRAWTEPLLAADSEARRLPPDALTLGDVLPVTYVPSATTLALQSELRRAQRPVPRLQYFGLAASPPERDAVDVEQHLVGKLYFPDSSDAVINPDLTPTARASLMDGIVSARYVHLAGHAGYFADDPMASGLYLGSDSKREHYISGYDIMTRAVTADVICVAGCQTGKGEYIPGQGSIGLARCLLFAGAHYAVVSLWPVASLATAAFMDCFFEALQQGHPAPEAARRARVWLFRRAGYASPAYRNAFIVVGSPDMTDVPRVATPPAVNHASSVPVERTAPHPGPAAHQDVAPTVASQNATARSDVAPRKNTWWRFWKQ
jgi:tetratricopeptide (TPR) repeat protein